ncbi:MAG: alpha-glucosidase C-terminal domain-containing protein, partial [Tannerella sp.]|nr:alpha-glucosidase C-terminal domain-containing protein [Tannerella sp.]
NKENVRFDSHCIYAFLRKYEQDVILVVANFDRTEQTARIILPPEAFRALSIPDNQVATLTDLFTGKQSVSTLTAACPFQVTVPACSGKLLKFTF